VLILNGQDETDQLRAAAFWDIYLPLDAHRSRDSAALARHARGRRRITFGKALGGRHPRARYRDVGAAQGGPFGLPVIPGLGAARSSWTPHPVSYKPACATQGCQAEAHSRGPAANVRVPTPSPPGSAWSTRTLACAVHNVVITHRLHVIAERGHRVPGS